MFIPVEDVHVDVLGDRVVPVVCEKCATKFFYKLTRVGRGKATGLKFVGRDSARDRAAPDARLDLERRLESDAELVPCPKCHWINEELIKRARRMEPRSVVFIVTMVALGFLGCMFVLSGISGLFGTEPTEQLAGVAVLFLGFGFLSPHIVLRLRRRKLLQMNPNELFPRPPRVVPGTPPALLMRSDPQTNQPQFVPVGFQYEEMNPSNDWFTINFDGFHFPPICCVCLNQATGSYCSPLMALRGLQSNVPICAACSREREFRWWGMLVLAAVMIFGFIVMIAYLIPTHDPGVMLRKWAMSITIGGAFSVITGTLIASWITAPYSVRTIDRVRHVFKFRFCNPAFIKELNRPR